MAKAEEVNEFLERFKSKMREYGLQRVRRKVNIREIAFTGILPHEMFYVIDDLCVEEYMRGPGVDHDGTSGEIWEFATKYKGEMIYIKLKLDDKAKCLSFHLAQFKPHFPFLEGDS